MDEQIMKLAPEFGASLSYTNASGTTRDVLSDRQVGLGGFVRTRLANDTTDHTFDATADAVTRIDSIEIDGTDLARPTVTWSAPVPVESRSQAHT